MAYGTVNADVIGTSVAGSNLGAGDASLMKNRIINGAMVIDQRNSGASVTQTTSSLYPVDRFAIYGSVTSKFTGQQSSTAPTGFNNSLLLTSSSAYTVGSAETYFLVQRIEGFNTADLGFGTANAKTVTLSFWVRSSLTGTFGGSLMNNAYDRSYPFSYTISAANTWEQKSVTIAGDTTGTWVGATNGVGLRVHWSLGTGSTLSTTAGSWAAGEYYSATGATSVVGTSGATFYITGVQLEVGSSATGFEYVNYQTSLANCQRYYVKYSGGPELRGVISSGYPTRMGMVLPVPMRATPTGTLIGTMSVYDGITAKDVTSISNDYSTSQTIEYNFLTGSTFGTNGYACVQYQNGAFSLSAEL
jgi:hypothetical protein